MNPAGWVSREWVGSELDDLRRVRAADRATPNLTDSYVLKVSP